MRLPSHTFRPKFNNRIEEGNFPSNLLFGFETEMSVWNIDAIGTEKSIKSLMKESDKFFYIKYDGSINGGSTGAEINSHPFNWNYILNHKEHIDNLSSLKDISGDGTVKFNGSKAKQFRINRTCGFHIHISKDYFTESHIKKITTFFYNNQEFIEEISQRKGIYALKRFANTSMKHETIDHFIQESTRYNHSAYRYKSLNICGTETIEIRIFQGTLNKECIWAYLEFALAVTLFTGMITKEKDLKPSVFIKYIETHKEIYGNFLDLYNKKITWE